MIAATESCCSDCQVQEKAVRRKILEQLISDGAFRNRFFSSPADALAEAGLDVGDEEMQKFRDTKWLTRQGISPRFEESGPLCCCVGY